MTMFMKAIVFLLIIAACNAENRDKKDEEKRTITKVVKMLQGMLKQSVKDGEEESKVFGKFKCFCDTAEPQKRQSIKALTSQIASLGSEVAEIRGVNGMLSSDIADLTERMAANKQAVTDAKKLRGDQEADYENTVADLQKAVRQLEDAIDTLAEVGGDQTLEKSADNKQFMAGFKPKKKDEKKKEASLLSLQSQVKEALRAASGLMTGKNLKAVTGFLQAPFTGTYTSQSAQVVGILKDMKATFISNAEDAAATEQRAKEAHAEWLETMQEAWDKMDESKEKKETEFSFNEKDLSTESSSLSSARKELSEEQDFLAKLVPNCEEKAESYAERNLRRANEEAAIAEAVSILNSDDAFAIFGGTDAGTTLELPKPASLVQLHSTHMASNARARSTAQTVLQKAVTTTHSARLSKVLGSLQAKSPFDTVLDEIGNMIQLIHDEDEEDEEKKKWCMKERRENKGDLNKKVVQIELHDEAIAGYKKQINGPTKGLNLLIEKTETSLLQNKEGQAEQTQLRKRQKRDFQKDVANLADAEKILGKAIKVLKEYYVAFEKKYEADLEKTALLQKDKPRKEGAGRYMGGDYSEGEYKGGEYKGQSKQGTNAIDLLDFIQEQTGKERDTAISQEKKFQEKYDLFMETSKAKQEKDEGLLAGYQEKLADAQKDLLDEREEREDTINDHDAIKDYLKKIKAGCDFISDNFRDRMNSRKQERLALEAVDKAIRGTPVYQAAKFKGDVEEVGDCKKLCVKNGGFIQPPPVECLACKADVSVPAYCAGHDQKAKGCPQNPRVTTKKEA